MVSFRIISARILLGALLIGNSDARVGNDDVDTRLLQKRAEVDALKELRNAGKKNKRGDVEECPTFIEDRPSCKVPDYCACDGKDHEGCDQCHGSSACVMISADSSICLPKDDALARVGGSRTRGCQVKDYEQCGGAGYIGCQKCMPGSFCVEDDMHFTCMPKKDIDRSKLKALPKEKVRGAANLMKGISANLDSELEDGSTDDEIIRWDMIRTFASEEGKARMKKLAGASRRRMQVNEIVNKTLLGEYNEFLTQNDFTQDQVDTYEEMEAEAQDLYREDLCELANNGAQISDSTRDCLCNWIEPALYCIAKVGVEYEEFVRQAAIGRALRGEEEEDHGIPFDADALADSMTELGKEVEEAARHEEEIQEAYEQVKVYLNDHPDFNGDVDASLSEARRVVEEALNTVYHSTEYDFEGFGGELGWHRDLRYCKATFGGSDDARFWAYAQAMINYVKTGEGCGGMDCAFPIPYTPLEVTLTLQACVATVPSSVPSSHMTNALSKFLFTSQFSIKMTAGLCIVGSDAIKTLLSFVGISVCFVEGGLQIWPMNGKLNMWIQFNRGPVYAKTSFTILTTDFWKNSLGFCSDILVQHLFGACGLCAGGFSVNFEIGANFFLWNPKHTFGPWSVSGC